MHNRAWRAYNKDDDQVLMSLAAAALNESTTVGQAADSGSMTSK